MRRGEARGGGGARGEERLRLQALVYDILPWRKVPESDARSVGNTVKGTDRERRFWSRSKNN